MVRAQFGPTVEGDVGCSGGTPSLLGAYGNQRALELCDASEDGEHHAPGQRRSRPRVPQQIEVQRFSPRSSLRCAHTQVAELHAAGFTALAYVSRPFLSHARSKYASWRAGRTARPSRASSAEPDPEKLGARSRRRQADLETLVTIDDQVGEFELAIARMANDPAMDVAEAPELLGRAGNRLGDVREMLRKARRDVIEA